MLRPLPAILLLITLSCSAFASLNEFPESKALGPWIDHNEMTEAGVDAFSYPSKTVKCGNTLYPTHPQQDLKKYHVYRTSQYDQTKISGTSIACLTHSNGKDTHGQISCLRADFANDVILSDVFMDACGEYYRGFIQIDFLAQDESMGTLMSRGRTMYPRPNAEFAGDYISGGTYAVPKSYFWKIGPVFPGDIQRINEDLSSGEAGFSYDAKSHLFNTK